MTSLGRNMQQRLFILCLAFSSIIVPESSSSLAAKVNSTLKQSESFIEARYAPPERIVDSVSYKIVCYYYAVESWYRNSRGMFLPEDIDATKCTHIHYAYAVLNPETLLIEPSDKWAEIDNRFYQRVLALKELNPRLRIMLSLGGWSESSEKFSTLVSNRLNRKAFVDHVITFLLLYGFDGLDVAWFFPVCWFGDCTKSGQSEDRENFGHFLAELKDAFDRVEPRLMVAVTVAGDGLVARRSYDFSALARLDYLNVMAFDYVAYWHQMTGHQASLYSQPGFPVELNVNSSIHLYLSRGIPSRKLILGVPAFGRSFTLVDPEEHSVRAPVKRPGIKGEFTLAEGLLAFYEICDRIEKKGWKLEKDPDSGMFYTYSGNQWVSFDPPMTVASKAEYVEHHNLGGIMIWDIDRDDFLGNCFGRKFPILSTINSALYRKPYRNQEAIEDH